MNHKTFAWALVLVIGVALACNDQAGTGPGEPESGTTGSDESTSSAGSTMGMGLDTTTITGGDTSGAGMGGKYCAPLDSELDVLADKPRAVFSDIGWPDQCSFFEQDCPPGHKCTYWEKHGILACAPLDDEPVGPGEPCSQKECGDDCDATSLCWKDACVPVCTGDVRNPSCEGERGCASAQRSAPSGNTVPLCLPHCDPFADDCDPQGPCTLSDLEPAFVCAPQPTSIAEPYGACSAFLSGTMCPSGWLCTERSPLCDDLWSCCVQLCELDGAASCVDPEHSCEAAFDEPELAHVGWCI